MFECWYLLHRLVDIPLSPPHNPGAGQGHADIKTTQRYIGAGEREGRKPPVVFDLPHSAADLSRMAGK